MNKISELKTVHTSEQKRRNAEERIRKEYEKMLSYASGLPEGEKKTKILEIYKNNAPI